MPSRTSRTLRVRPLPRESGGRGWLDLPPPPPPPGPPLAGTDQADVVVVGAGFTGLAAARRLAELAPSRRVVVLEARRAGDGASGRSSGFVVDIAHFTTTLPEAAARRHAALARSGIGTLRRLVAEHAIECAWDDTGWVHAAAGDAGLADLATLGAWLDAHDEAYETLDADAMERLTGTAFYRRGLRLPGRPLVQAAALVRGLAAALPPTVRLYEQSPVLGLERRDGRWRLDTAGGTVDAGAVVLATNAYTGAFGGLLGRQVFPLVTFGSLTRPLTEDEQAAIGGEREWGVLAQDPLGSSLRRTRDQRLLVRNTVHHPTAFDAPEAVREAARRLHRRALAARYPQLAEIELEPLWGGVMAATPARVHYFGRLAEGIFGAAGFTGAGIAMGTTAGELLAELALGRRSERLEDMLALPRPRRLPPQPFLRLGIRWRVRRMNRQAVASPTL